MTNTQSSEIPKIYRCSANCPVSKLYGQAGFHAILPFPVSRREMIRFAIQVKQLTNNYPLGLRPGKLIAESECTELDYSRPIGAEPLQVSMAIFCFLKVR